MSICGSCEIMKVSDIVFYMMGETLKKQDLQKTTLAEGKSQMFLVHVKHNIEFMHKWAMHYL